MFFIIILSVLIVFGPPFLLWVLGRSQDRNGKDNSAKILYILAIVYLIVGLGACGGIIGF